jgi:hypothetical protein
MFSTATIKEIESVARAHGIEPAALLAIAEVESGGRAIANVGGRKEPLIRFEGHYFDRLVADGKRNEARSKGLASPTMGAVKNPASQSARWRLLEEAMAIDRKAALQSVSWGIGQVMGSHWKSLGYGSVESLVDEARSGVAGQVRLMLRFLEKNGLIGVIEARDWAAFARAYNGPRYKVHRYDSRIAAAYARHARDSGQKDKANGLRRGDRGEDVADLQRMLTAAGHPLAPDGRFGPATARRVEDFQAEKGLVVDGVAGPRTLAALRAALPGSTMSGKAVWLTRLVRNMLPLVARIVRKRSGPRV